VTAWTLPDPVPVREIENQWIVMPDGVHLAVQLWLPDVAEPAPVVLEHIPYRKRDSTRAYSGYWGRQLASRGVGYARLDARGSGDSGGLLPDEYLPLEQRDAVAAIAWLAAQPWCNGAVGMRGVSWGGFITLQVAAHAPPPLKAIMPMCASDRRYTDDAHYVGGAFALTGLKWATTFKAVMAGPPDPAIFGAEWERGWMQRLEAAPAIAALWLSHQREDDYWRQGSVAFDDGAIRCPTYLVGGWTDPYNEAIPRLLQHLTVPAKALIGPWGHGYPAPASPGPGLGWAFEEVRWWRQWLAGEETGIMRDPRVWAYMPEQSAIHAAPGPIPGRWVAAEGWPPATEALTFHLAAGRLDRARAEGVGGLAELRSDAVVGLQTPEWVPFSPAQYPQEQSPDDGRSLIFESAPLEAPLEFLGSPVLRLRLASSAPVARLAARLTEVAPDGRSWPITYGVLNLTHRASHAEPRPMTPGVFEVIELSLYVTARRLAAGTRLRLALSEGLWPLLWPAPEPVALSLDLTDAALSLPVRADAAVGPAFPIPVASSAPSGGRGDPVMTRERSPDGWVRFEETCPTTLATIRETGTTVERCGVNVELKMRADDPNTCLWRASYAVRYARGDWDCQLKSEVEITSSATHFHVLERLEARRGAALVFEREHESDVPRDLM
jgi:putative CocE/NonD family hydrolase